MKKFDFLGRKERKERVAKILEYCNNRLKDQGYPTRVQAPSTADQQWLENGWKADLANAYQEGRKLWAREAIDKIPEECTLVIAKTRCEGFDTRVSEELEMGFEKMVEAGEECHIGHVGMNFWIAFKPSNENGESALMALPGFPKEIEVSYR